MYILMGFGAAFFLVTGFLACENAKFAPMIKAKAKKNILLFFIMRELRSVIQL